MRIAIVTDSTSDLSAAEEERYGVAIVPLYVLFGEETFRDRLDITPGQFYEKLSHSSVLPTTSQPSQGDFEKSFGTLLQSHDAVIGLFISGDLSGTVRAAEAAAAGFPEGAVTVVDTRLTSGALALVVLEAVRMARSGAGVGEIVRRVESMKDNVRAYFVLDSLEHLRRGGRIGGAAALVGSILQIKPVLVLRDGRIDVFEKVRTSRRAIERILDEFEREARDRSSVNAVVVHGAAALRAEELRMMARDRVPHARIQVQQLGPIVGVHAGPGVLALIYHSE